MLVRWDQHILGYLNHHIHFMYVNLNTFIDYFESLVLRKNINIINSQYIEIYTIVFILDYSDSLK